MDFDQLTLNFTPGTLLILNIVLGLIMFGIAWTPSRPTSGWCCGIRGRS